MTIEKVGQYPSLATIANDEVSQYRKDMNPIDAQEFHKAIGLAAHGVGVGSFVYLRVNTNATPNQAIFCSSIMA